MYSPDGKRLATGSERHAIRCMGRGDRQAADDGSPAIRELYGPSRSVRMDGGSPPAVRTGHSAFGTRQRASHSPSSARTKGSPPCPLCSARTESGSRPAGGKEIRLWDGRRASRSACSAAMSTRSSCLAIIWDGRRIASVARDEKVIVLWDPATRKQVASLAGHTDRNPWLVISPAGSRLISATWDFRGSLATTLGCVHGPAHQGHGRTHKYRRVKSVAFSPDGTRVVSGSLDQTAFLWDGLTGERIAALRGHSGMLSGSTFQPRRPVGCDHVGRSNVAALAGPRRER